jgi:hypothetical protein
MKEIDLPLVALYDLLNPIKGDWMIIGTSSLYLSGYPVEPNDIDILTDAITAKEIEQLLAGYKVGSQVKPNEKFRSVFSQYNLNNFNIEVMANLEINTANGWVLLRDQIMNTQTALFNGKAFTVPSKADQIAIYTLFDRDKDQKTLMLLNG